MKSEPELWVLLRFSAKLLWAFINLPEANLCQNNWWRSIIDTERRLGAARKERPRVRSLRRRKWQPRVSPGMQGTQKRMRRVHGDRSRPEDGAALQLEQVKTGTEVGLNQCSRRLALTPVRGLPAVSRDRTQAPGASPPLHDAAASQWSSGGGRKEGRVWTEAGKGSLWGLTATSPWLPSASVSLGCSSPVPKADALSAGMCFSMPRTKPPSASCSSSPSGLQILPLLRPTPSLSSMERGGSSLLLWASPLVDISIF